MKLNSEGHDESQYLPKKWYNPRTGREEDYPIVNPFREKHGGVVTEGKSIKALTWLPDKLHLQLDTDGNQLINGDQLNTCRSFYRAVVSTRNELRIDNVRNLVGQSPTPGEPTDIFFAVVRGLLPYQANMCLWVVCDEYNRGNLELAQKLIVSIQNSLDLAQKIIDSL